MPARGHHGICTPRPKPLKATPDPGAQDPVRKEVPEAVRMCQRAGIMACALVAPNPKPKT